MMLIDMPLCAHGCACIVIQGADEAGERIATLDVFKNAEKVKVDPDKPLQHARYVTLKVSP